MKKKLFIANYLIPVLFIIHYILVAVIINVAGVRGIAINYPEVLLTGGMVSLAYIIIRFLTSLFLDELWFSIIASLALSFILVSRLFNYMHWPMSSLMLYTGVFFLIVAAGMYLIREMRGN